MSTYRCQVRMIDCRQVDVETDTVLPVSEIEKLAAQQAQAEFGEVDYVEIEQIERVWP